MWKVVPVVLALITAQPVLAAPPLPEDSETIPVIRGGQVTQLDPAALIAVTQYYISFRCLRRGEVVNESQVAMRGGAPAVFTSAGQRGGSVRYSAFVLIDESATAGRPQVLPVNGPAGALLAIVPEGSFFATATAPVKVLAAAQHFSCAGLDFTVYCPGADWIEIEIQRRETDAPWLRRLPGELLPEFVPGVEHPLQFAGRLSCAYSCADVGYVSINGWAPGELQP